MRYLLILIIIIAISCTENKNADKNSDTDSTLTNIYTDTSNTSYTEDGFTAFFVQPLSSSLPTPIVPAR